MTSYGTAFEVLEDEERNAVTKKPRGVQDEIVTDERGKRRFHGAFTGGFSAGYFNTAGSKHGWVPQTFKSSKDTRAKVSQDVQDFMDEEDFGEFGIASRKLRTKHDFMETLAQPGDQNQLAWERSVSVLADLLRPVNDSIGVRLLKQMGWRPGKGIGPKVTKRVMEKRRVREAAGRGETINFDAEVVEEIETHIPNAEFAPEDVSSLFFTPKENVHGLGYNPLKDTGVLTQNYGVVATGLKTSKSGKAIRGQAFGVGAFEEEDEDVYTNFDLSQYDFEIGGKQPGTMETPRFDSSFVPAKKTSNSRKFFAAPRLPPHFRPVHKPQELKVKHLSQKVLNLGEKMSPFERARFLGDRDHSVLDLLSEKDRQFLQTVKDEKQKVLDKKKQSESEPFEEEPLKAHRFKKFVSYLKRGLYFEQPPELTRLEWNEEFNQFKNALTPELRALLPEVRSRHEPLAKLDYAQPIAEKLQARFQKESSFYAEKSTEKQDDLQTAVKMKAFGDLTRKKYKWYPAKELCKRFNVPNPYPDSSFLGVPELQKVGKPSSDLGISDLGVLPTTSMEVKRNEQPKENKIQQVISSGKNVAIVTHKPPAELLKALFEESESSSSSESELEDEPSLHPSQGQSQAHSFLPDRMSQDDIKIETPLKQMEKVITVLDLVEDDDVYGPTLPPSSTMMADGQGPKIDTLQIEASQNSDDSKAVNTEKINGIVILIPTAMSKTIDDTFV
ncbi:g-patch domain-containing protein [Ditylenchus destructor]|nr:g-patch domain-containing protein [Ditylenchus destructor]